MALTSAAAVLVDDAAEARSPPPAGSAGVASMAERARCTRGQRQLWYQKKMRRVACSIIFVTKSVCLDHPHRFLTSPNTDPLCDSCGYRPYLRPEAGRCGAVFVGACYSGAIWTEVAWVEHNGLGV